MCGPGFRRVASSESCFPLDYDEYYALFGDSTELKQYYFSGSRTGEATFGERSVDAMDVDVVNRVVYFVDESLNEIKVWIEIMFGVCMYVGSVLTQTIVACSVPRFRATLTTWVFFKPSSQEWRGGVR